MMPEFIFLPLLLLASLSLVAMVRRLKQMAKTTGSRMTLAALSNGLLPGYFTWRIAASFFWYAYGAPRFIIVVEAIAAAVSILGWILVARQMNRPNSFLGRRSMLSLGSALTVLIVALILQSAYVSHLGDVEADLQRAAADQLLEKELLSPLDVTLNSGRLLAKYNAAHSAHPMDVDLSELVVKGVDDPEFVAVITAIQSVVDLARQAADQTSFRLPMPAAKITLMASYPQMGQMREAAMLLSYSARWEANTGRMDQAIADTHRVYAMANQAYYLPGYVGQLVRIGISALGDKTVVCILPAVQTHADLDKLHRPMPDLLQTDLARGMRMERAIIGKTLLNFGGMVNLPMYRWAGMDTWLRVAYRENARNMMLDHELFMEQFNLPFAQSYPQWTSHMKARGSQGAITLQMLAMNPALSCLVKYRRQADFLATDIAIAATRYRLDLSSAYPDAPKDLVPKYLPAWPEDPFLPGQPMQMKKLEDGSLVIWSVGKNQTDEQGDVPNDRQPDRREFGDIGYILQPAQPRPQ